MKTTPQQVSRLELGARKLNTEWLEKIETALSVDRGEIWKAAPRAVKLHEAGAGIEFDGDPFDPVPGYDADAAAGPGALNADFPEPSSFHLFRRSWLRALTHATLEKLAVINVRGDSMTPTLLNGDQVLIDRSVTQVGREAFYVLVMNDDLQVKRISRDPRTKALLVSSDNPLSDRWEGVSDNDIYILGRVVWLARSL